MKTELIKADKRAIEKAVKILRKGGIVAFPTETVYGLGACALNKEAVKKIFKAKGRPEDDPLIVHISNIKDVKKLVSNMPFKAKMLIKRFWPGPLTIIFKKSDKVTREVTAGLDTVAIRMPSNKIALELCRKAGPIAAPSANSFGKPSPTKAEHVYQDLKNKIPLIIDGGDTDIGLESTIISLVEKPRLLRPGKITLEELRKYLHNIEIMTSVKRDEKPLAPGMKYRHYAPDKPAILVRDTNKIRKVIKEEKAKNRKVGLLCTTRCGEADEVILVGKKSEDVAKILFNALRYLDRRVDVIIVESVEEKGLGLAIMNRLRRAASKILD